MRIELVDFLDSILIENEENWLPNWMNEWMNGWMNEYVIDWMNK